MERIEIPQKILEIRNKVGGFLFPNFKIYHKIVWTRWCYMVRGRGRWVEQNREARKGQTSSWKHYEFQPCTMRTRFGRKWVVDERKL